MVILGLALVGNDAVKHANRLMSQTTRVFFFFVQMSYRLQLEPGETCVVHVGIVTHPGTNELL